MKKSNLLSLTCFAAILILISISCSKEEPEKEPVIDTVTPLIDCPSDIEVYIDQSNNGFEVTYTVPVGRDNNPGSITTQTTGIESGGTFPVGTTENTFEVKDEAGNVGTCSFKVTINQILNSEDRPYFLGNDPTPDGGTWEPIPEFTDEFEGPEIDSDKWETDPFAHPHQLWAGRVPALFQEESLKIQDGELTIEVGKFPEPVTAHGWGPNSPLFDYTFYGGILRSKATTNVGNYYECKMKMSKTEMGGGFWLMGFTYACDKVHEIDVTESVGILTDATHEWARNAKWDEIYHSNSIRREDPCDSEQERDGDYINTPTKNHEKYYVYGLWRKSATELLFYLDGEYQFTLNPPVPFDQELYMQFSIESYDWNPFAENGSQVELASLEDRLCHVEYIRSFKLID